MICKMMTSSESQQTWLTIWVPFKGSYLLPCSQKISVQGLNWFKIYDLGIFAPRLLMSKSSGCLGLIQRMFRASSNSILEYNKALSLVVLCLISLSLIQFLQSYILISLQLMSVLDGIPEFLNSGRKCWMLDSGRLILGVELWTLDSGRWTLDFVPSFVTRCSK